MGSPCPHHGHSVPTTATLSLPQPLWPPSPQHGHSIPLPLRPPCPHHNHCPHHSHCPHHDHPIFTSASTATLSPHNPFLHLPPWPPCPHLGHHSHPVPTQAPVSACPPSPRPLPGAGLPRSAVAARSQPWPRPRRIPPWGRAVPGGPGRSRAAPGRGDISPEKGAGGGIRHCRPGSAGPAPQVGRGWHRAPGAGGHVMERDGTGHRERHGHRDSDGGGDGDRLGSGPSAPGARPVSPKVSPRTPR